MATEFRFSEKSTNYLLDISEELPKVKAEADVPEKTKDERSGTTISHSQTMEDVAKKYREAQINEDFKSENSAGDNSDVDDDELLSTDNEVCYAEFESTNESADDPTRPPSVYAASSASARRPSDCSVTTNLNSQQTARSTERPVSQASSYVKRSGRASERFSRSSSTAAWAADSDYLRRLEADQEELSGSLLALTSHFAQVQFRLKQVKAAPPAEKERLLSELEALAFRGVPDLRAVYEDQADDGENGSPSGKPQTSNASENGKVNRNIPRAGARGRRQAELIEQLKAQLTDLEQFAYESGELSALPTAKRLHNQRVLMDRLQQRLALRSEGTGTTGEVEAGLINDLLCDLERVPAEEQDFDALVERAVGAILNPVRVKEKVVEQLKTQIVDLERFIAFLQHGGGDSSSSSGVGSPSAIAFGNTARSINAPSRDRAAAKQRPDGVGETRRTEVNRRNLPIETEPAAQSPEHVRAEEAETTSSHPHNGNGNGRAKSTRPRDENFNAAAARPLVKRIATLVHIFVLSNLACMNRERVQLHPNAGANGTSASHANSVREHHYGQPLARLKVLVDLVCQMAADYDFAMPVLPTDGSADVRSSANLNDYRNVKLYQGLNGDSSVDTSETPAQPDSVAYASDDDECYLAVDEHLLTSTVRKKLLPALRALLEHGMLDERSLRPAVAACFSSAARSTNSSTNSMRGAHAWRLFARYYELKGGRQWNSQPARNLSAAFAIDVVGGRTVSAKYALLAAIDQVLELHSKFKRSDDAKFKALCCIALNQRQIVPWLRLVVRNQTLVDEFYESWAYVAMTGFDDALQALSRLKAFAFHLPFDVAVRQLQNIRDVF